MDQRQDPRNVFSALHLEVTSHLAKLMEGFYFNVEDGLFELAYRHQDASRQKYCFELMRELRYRRATLLQTFVKRMHKGLECWFDEGVLQNSDSGEFEILAERMAQKCSAHFGGLLQTIAERAAYATDRDLEAKRLPISPYQVSLHFIASCRSLEFDKEAIEVVQELFCRFVLDRLGSIYGNCNRRLENAGFYAMRELEAMTEQASTA